MTDVCIARVARPVTLKRSRPNPLFQEWLEELLDEAKQKKCKIEQQLTEALTSLSKYPLPINSGAECKILKGFDSRLCDFIEQRLRTHNNYKHNVKHKPVTHHSKLNLEFNKHKNYIKQLLSYSSILISLKNLWIDGKEHIPLRELLSHSSKQIGDIQSKLVASKLSLTRFPQHFRPIRDFIKMDSVTNNCSLTDTGLSEAYYVEHLLNEYKYTVDSSIQVKIDLPIVSVGSSDVTNDDEAAIEMEAGSFDIILLIDKNETSGLSNKNDPTVTQFKKYLDLKHEYRSLKVGDFAWIARHKVNVNQELVLPYIVERKRLDDLSASIKDGRFHEQKFRLRRCGLPNVIYLVESYTKKKYIGLPVQTLMQALANTRVQDGFKVHITDCLVNSVRFLAMMTKRLHFEFENKPLKGRNGDVDSSFLMTFDYFNKMSVKNKPLTVTEMFIKLLLQLKGLSVEKAMAITNVYRTPKSLIQAYEHLDKDDGETLLANMKYGDLNRNVGPAVSKSIYQLFSSLDLS